MFGFDLSAWSTLSLVSAFLATAALLTAAGIRITDAGAALAHRTGLGQALFGAAFIGGATSLSGIVVSVHAAGTGRPKLALANALGGIAAQTVFLALADFLHKRANLEHAAASAPNMFQAGLLMTLLAMPSLALGAPEVAILGVSPASLAILMGYFFGLKLASRVQAEGPWTPRRTAYTVDEDSETEDASGARLAEPLQLLWLRFCVLAGVLGLCGYAVGTSSVELASRFGLSESAAGTFLTAITTSLPEMVTAFAAVHRGALALAVGDILGGNVFDTLLIALSDVAYRKGSIFEAFDHSHVVTTGMAQILTGLTLLGLIRREKHGIGNIGFESILSMLAYALGAIVLLR